MAMNKGWKSMAVHQNTISEENNKKQNCLSGTLTVALLHHLVLLCELDHVSGFVCYHPFSATTLNLSVKKHCQEKMYQ